MMRFDVDAILFDIDGTLVNSTAAVERTWRTWAAERGIDAESLLAISHGRRTECAAAVADLEGRELSDLDDVIALPGTHALLAELPADRWATVTSGSRLIMSTRLNAAGLPISPVMIPRRT